MTLDAVQPRRPRSDAMARKGYCRLRASRMTAPLAVFMISMACRLGYELLALRHYSPQADSESYLILADSFARGEGLADFGPPGHFGDGGPTAFRPPLYPVILGIFRALGFDSLGAAQLLNIVLGSLTVLLAFLLVRTAYGKVAALIASGLMAVSPALVAADSVILSDTLGNLLTIAIVSLAFKAMQAARCTPLVLAMTGIVAGLLILTRPPALLLAIGVASHMALASTHKLRVAALVGGFTLATLTPWLVWTAGSPDIGGASITTSYGFTLLGRYSEQTVKSDSTWIDPFTTPELQYLYRGERSEVEQDRVYLRAAVQQMTRRPESLIQVPLENLVTMTGIGADARRADSVDGRPLVMTRLSTAGFLLAVATVICLVWRRQGTPFQLLDRLLVVAATSTVIPLLWSVAWPRLRAPLDLLLLCLAAGLVERQTES